MKAIGISFSGRTDGNCSKTVDYVLDQLRQQDFKTEKADFATMVYERCGSCGYYCFKSTGCLFKDDMTTLYEKCIDADMIFLVIPTYNGHLASNYFAFSERYQGFFKDKDIDQLLFKKLNFIIIGNIDHGVETALHEALNHVAHRSIDAKSMILAPRVYGLSAINDTLVAHDLVQLKLDAFIDEMVSKYKTVELKG